MRHQNGNCLVIGGFCTSVNDEYCNGLREAYECGALRETRMSGWVSIKERLPEEQINPNTHDFEYVLCATTFGDVRAYKYGRIGGSTEAHFGHGFGIVDKYITHWMPLPEPPKEVSE